MRKLLVVFLLVISVLGFSVVKNVIYMVGDGMGINQAMLASYLEGRLMNFMKTQNIGIVTTFSANSNVTDSAAAGTALFSGFKTNNGMIGMLPDGTVVPTIAEIAAKNGVKIGVISTSRITHATPGAVYGHVESRGDENTLAEQLVNSPITVAFGGGWRHFIPTGGKRKDGKDLIKLAKEKGFDYINTKEELLNYTGEKVLGLFNYSHLPAASDRVNEPMLADMTKKALEVLSKDNDPFFLMVEGSQIDWEAHGNDPYGLWKEVLEFEKAFDVVMEFVKNNPDTLVIVTADHETGGLGLSTGGYYFDVEMIRKFTKNTDFISKQSNKDKAKLVDLVKKYYGIELTDEDMEYFDSLMKEQSGSYYAFPNSIGRVVSKKAHLGWTTFAHTGAPVAVYAFGAGAENFNGFYDNTEIVRIIGRLAGYPVIYPVFELPASGAH
ncbi:alkaline phosphatase [Marinitoga hydrogenitolerans DSM 16785]|uniref:Alkaline phosphatase n=1 Tax=Marinitoga hydrogenitolerans (strain DSM 16785 / JCM 12826 / AT1271) TaxID=1122195 RepID=A0A1M4XBZ4_MARH1|nr:alkaline phosphatase [Marinitoga hydrogenitolerans]SHE91054.1 alkaline phosphatase [Marinitoga hydrogenitolerans DSM 16785]